MRGNHSAGECGHAEADQRLRRRAYLLCLCARGCRPTGLAVPKVARVLFLVNIEAVDQQRLRLARHALAWIAHDEVQDRPVLQIQIKMPQKVDFRSVVPFRKTRQVVFWKNAGNLVVKHFAEVDLVIDEVQRVADRQVVVDRPFESVKASTLRDQARMAIDDPCGPAELRIDQAGTAHKRI
jgi:hypothetical protein